MKQPLQTLLTQAGDRSDLERQRDAIRQLWLFLEMKHRPVLSPAEQTFYEKQLPEPLRSLTLEEGEEQALIAGLHRLVVAARSPAVRYLPPFSTASPRVAIEPLLDLLLRHRDDTWSPEDTWSLLIALENALDVFTAPEGGSVSGQAPAVVAAIRRHDPRAALRELARVPDDRLAEIAQRVRDKVDKLFEDRKARI